MYDDDNDDDEAMNCYARILCRVFDRTVFEWNIAELLSQIIRGLPLTFIFTRPPEETRLRSGLRRFQPRLHPRLTRPLEHVAKYSGPLSPDAK